MAKDRLGKIRALIDTFRGTGSTDSDEIEERRESPQGRGGRRRSDRELLPSHLKYAWALVVTLLVITSTVLGERSKYAYALDGMIRALTGGLELPADKPNTSQ